MRRLVLIGTPLVAVVGLFAAAVLVVLSVPQRARAAPRTCQATLGPWVDPSASRGAAAAAQLDAEQIAIVKQIIRIGKQRGLPARAWQIAIQAGMTESRLRNLHHGHADSLGIFQQRPSAGWGTPEQITTPEYAINAFYDALLQVEGWRQMRPGAAAQAVQRSAFPDRYHQWEAMAAYLVGHYGTIPNPTGCGGGAAAPASEVAATVIQAAKSQLGVPYAWGGGTIHGPSSGIPPDDHVVGFDCSSLTMYAYYQVGIRIPRLAAAQYGAGKHVPFSQAQPGDLVFWATNPANPATIHHVAIYLGNGTVIHAPHSGTVVQIDPIWHQGLVPTVTRPGVADE